MAQSVRKACELGDGEEGIGHATTSCIDGGTRDAVSRDGGWLAWIGMGNCSSRPPDVRVNVPLSRCAARSPHQCSAALLASEKTGWFKSKSTASTRYPGPHVSTSLVSQTKTLCRSNQMHNASFFDIDWTTITRNTQRYRRSSSPENIRSVRCQRHG